MFTPVDEAIARLRASSRLLAGTESVAIAEALGRVLAEDVVSTINVPPAANSAMDGYALRRADWPGAEQAIPVSQRIPAGSVPQALQPGTAARIFTGAELPEGADTVVMQENTADGSQASVRIVELCEPGDNIRPKGQDIAAGDMVAKQGARLRPQDLGQVAAVGRAQISCFRRLQVALVSTGDELAEPGSEAKPGQIYNSNRYTVRGLLQAWGYEMIDMGVAEDTPEAVRNLLLEAAERADVILTTGGVSVGEEDHVRDVVAELGAIDLWKIAIKPGKPFAFGHIRGSGGETPFLGLPGNPVSVFVTLAIIARPYLAACQGATRYETPFLSVPADFDHPGSSREEYLRVQLRHGKLALFSNQSSGVLTSLSASDGLVRQRVGEDIKQGDLVDYLPLSTFG